MPGDSPVFNRFIAIDWSGAKSGYARKIQVGVAEEGDNAPTLVTPKGGWTRKGVLDWLRGEINTPSLIGFDFSFAPPFVDRGAYLPGEETADSGPGFWAYVDGECDDADLGAASFLERRRGTHFYLGKADGVKARFMRLRQCEITFNAQGGGKPSSVFDAIGAAQVAKASFSGMRVLHHLRPYYAIWPFDEGPRDNGSLVVEIYCRLFLRHALGRGLKVRDFDGVNKALASLGSKPIATPWAGLSDDESDVLVASAGLRHFAGHPKYWNCAALSASVRAREGWTFGVVEEG